LNRRYWDSDCFLGYLMEEPDKVGGCQQVIDEAEAGKLVIVTSALTLAEVVWIRGRPKVPADRDARVTEFFEHDWIVVFELDRKLAEAGRRLVWEQGVRPKDAIHVATALDAKVMQLDIFDTELHKLSGELGGGLVIGQPSIPGKLF
jgi:predicted nucleic acid-binding protein